MAPETPVVIIAHTMFGGTREPCTKCIAEEVIRFGWRAVVANNRGCSGAEITSERSFDAIRCDDLQYQISHIRNCFKAKFLFIVGFSLGSYQSVSYSNEDGNVDGIACISHSFRSAEPYEVNKPIQKRLYTSVILQKCRRFAEKNKFLSDEFKNK